MKVYWDGNSAQVAVREGNVTQVIKSHGYHHPGEAAVELTNTGNGYIAKFPAHDCTRQDYYVCLDYSQVYDLILALGEFKKELGFK